MKQPTKAQISEAKTLWDLASTELFAAADAGDESAQRLLVKCSAEIANWRLRVALNSSGTVASQVKP